MDIGGTNSVDGILFDIGQSHRSRSDFGLISRQFFRTQAAREIIEFGLRRRQGRHISSIIQFGDQVPSLHGLPDFDVEHGDDPAFFESQVSLVYWQDLSGHADFLYDIPYSRHGRLIARCFGAMRPVI